MLYADRQVNFRKSDAIVVAQFLLAIVVLAVVIFAPPREGEMLVLPLAGASMADTSNWIIEHDGRIVSAGPFAGALIIFGTRDALAMPALAHGALLIALPDVFCGRKDGQSWR